MMTAASEFTTSVIADSTRPAAISADSWLALAYCHCPAIIAATELPPLCSTCQLSPKIGVMTSSTAIASPRARPTPSMQAPTAPPRPKGSTTVRTMPHLVDPSAYAASRSACGAWENTSRDSEVMIGMAIRETTIPATIGEPTNVELLAWTVVRNGGNQCRGRDGQLMMPITWGIRKYRPQTP